MADDRDAKTNADIDEVVKTLNIIAMDLLDGRGFAVGVSQLWDASKAGKRLAGKENAGRDVFARFWGKLVTEKPEVIDIAFAGMGEVAKARLRKMFGGPEEIKPAEKT